CAGGGILAPCGGDAGRRRLRDSWTHRRAYGHCGARPERSNGACRSKNLMTADETAIDWPKLVIGMLGGDKREQEIARRAALTGAEVRAHGFPWPEHGIAGVQQLSNPAAVLKGARFALFPIPGIAASGALFAPAAPAA